MKYAQHRSNIKKSRPVRSRKGRRWLWVLLVIALIFIFGALLRGSNKSEPVQEELTEAIDEIVEEQTVAGEEANTDDLEQITLDFVGEEGSGSAIARRGTAGDLFTHVVVAELPVINSSTHFYEGWLVKPGVTQFFSTGEMFPRADGKWGLVWEESVSRSDVKLEDYSKVVITLEPRDGDPAPAAEHVLEGEF